MLVLASQCAGCVLSGANAAYTADEMAHQVSDSSAAVILVHPQLMEVALAATTKLGWSKKQQREKIVLAVRDDEAGMAAERACRVTALRGRQDAELIAHTGLCRLQDT